MEPAVVLDIFDKRPFADCLSQLDRIRETWSFGEVPRSAAAALTDRRLDPSLLRNKRPDVIAFE
jgi:hypothetical protein